IVVGGASGIGRTAAKALARQGARLVIADFDMSRMERTVEEILQLGTCDAALALPTDVRSDASVRSMAGDAIKAMGQVDVLINMAGVLLKGKLGRLKSSDWRWMLDTNLLGPGRTATAILPHLLERPSGPIGHRVRAGRGPDRSRRHGACRRAVNVPNDLGLLSSIGICTGAAALIAAVTWRFKQPLIIAYLLTGVIIGPNIGLRWITDQNSIQTVAEIGL